MDETQALALIRGLSALLEVEREARRASSMLELEYIMTNRTLVLLPAVVALFWRRGGAGAMRLERISGLPTVERGTPFVQWAERMLVTAAAGREARTCHTLTEQSDDEAHALVPSEWLWCPLVTTEGVVFAGLWLAREQPWLPADLALAERLAETYTHACEHRDPGCIRRLRRGTIVKHWLVALVAVAGIAVLMVPVAQTTLAPAEIVALDPLVVTAPADGAIETVEVIPNEPVQVGQVLFTLNETALRNRYEVAVMARRVAEAELHKARQLAFQDSASQASLTMLEAQIALRSAEAAFAAELLARTKVHAGRAGIVLFADPNELRGRPVMTGERVMTIADPIRAEIAIQLPADDATTLLPGAPVRLYLNIAPLTPLSGRLTRASYEAIPTPEGVLAYRLKASLDRTEAPPRIGLKGTARISGPEAPLILTLIRRPLAVLRRWVGW
ncbi:MAG: HlyD family efflux transporter periplasmic adaptor subunit [Rhodospirillaceae bacterium]